MRDYDEHFKSDYQGRDIQSAYAEARQMVDTILIPPDQTPLETRKEIARKTVRNFRDHINKGFLDYRKSVTEATNFAVTEWTGEGSVLVDALDREFLDLLGGFGLYSYGIRHPKIVASVKAQLDRSPQYSQEMLDPLRAQLAEYPCPADPWKNSVWFLRQFGNRGCRGRHETGQTIHRPQGVYCHARGISRQNPGGLSLIGKKSFENPCCRCWRVFRHVPFGDADAVEAGAGKRKGRG